MRLDRARLVLPMPRGLKLVPKPRPLASVARLALSALGSSRARAIDRERARVAALAAAIARHARCAKQGGWGGGRRVTRAATAPGGGRGVRSVRAGRERARSLVACGSGRAGGTLGAGAQGGCARAALHRRGPAHLYHGGGPLLPPPGHLLLQLLIGLEDVKQVAAVGLRRARARGCVRAPAPCAHCRRNVQPQQQQAPATSGERWRHALTHSSRCRRASSSMRWARASSRSCSKAPPRAVAVRRGEAARAQLAGAGRSAWHAPACPGVPITASPASRARLWSC